MVSGDIEPVGSQPSLILLERVRKGDDAARNELIQRYWPRLARWAHGRLPMSARDLHDTADLVQDTMIAALHRLQDFAPEHAGSLQAYLRVALMNRIRNLAHRAHRRGVSAALDSALADAAPSPMDVAIGSETLERYERALTRLRPADREVIILRVELDLPYEEIAAQLAKPTVLAARKATSRALYHLAREMQRDA